MSDTPTTSRSFLRRAAGRLRAEFQQRPKQFRWWLYNLPRHPKPFATHLPILAGLPILRPIRKVVEFGSGPFSTGAFLRPEVYPDLERLESYDDDPDWFQRVQQQNIGENKLSLTLVNGPVSGAVAGAGLADADLIFIDDSKTREARAETIKSVCAHLPDNAWVVIHDFEVRQYKKAARLAPHRYAFTTLRPHVGVLWKSNDDSADKLKQLEKKIRNKHREIPIEDLKLWHDYLAQ